MCESAPFNRLRSPSAFTLIEVLTATAVTAILIIALASILNQATSAFSKGVRQVDIFMEARASLNFLRQDLEGTVSGRAMEMPPPKIRPGGSPVASYRPGDNVFHGHYMIPFEVNRTRGKVYRYDTIDKREQEVDPAASSAVTKAFMNSVPEDTGSNTAYHRNFDALSFYSLSPLTRQVFTSVDRGNFGGGNRGRDNSRNSGDVCLVGYYVAYTYDSPLPGARRSMKLHRHYRDSGSWWVGRIDVAEVSDTRLRDFSKDWEWEMLRVPAQSRAHIPLYMLSGPMRWNLEGQVYANEDLPYLLAPVEKYHLVDTIHPFPVNAHPSYDDLAAPPPPQSILERFETGLEDGAFNNKQYYVYPDEPLAFNVVRFKVYPVRRATPDLEGVTAQTVVLNAKALNRAYAGAPYNLDGGSEEWPVILAPDMVDIELTVIDNETASKFKEEDDWLRWDTDPDRAYLKRLVESNSQSFRTRIHVRASEWLE